MELKEMHFRYNVASRQFNQFIYRLCVIETPIKKEELLSLMDNSFEDIEEILHSVYGEKNMQKKITGNISNNVLSKGYAYEYAPSKMEEFLGHKQCFSGELSVNLWTSSASGDSVDISLTCYDHRYPNKNLLGIHDQILIIKDLGISREAQEAIRRIEYLRRQTGEINLGKLLAE